MSETTDEARRVARRRRHEAIRAEVADEETEAIEAEIAEKAGALEVPLHRPRPGRPTASAGS